MKKGIANVDQLQIELGISFYHGYTVAKCEGFAERLGLSATEFTRRLGTLLAPAAEIRQPLGLPDSVQVLRAETGARGQSLESLALDDGSHGGPRGHGEMPGATGQADSRNQALSARDKKISDAQHAIWDNLTPRERTAKTLARYEAIKHPTPIQKKAMATLRAKLAGKIPHKVDTGKQKIYAARAQAKKHGLPMPPLPKEMTGESKEERRRRLDRENKQARRDAQKRAAGKYKATSKQAAGAKSAWSGMTAAQRGAEMKRRHAGGQEEQSQESLEQVQ